MLSVEECRKVLDKPELTDEQVIQIRDALYCLAHAFTDEILRHRQKGSLRQRD